MSENGHEFAKVYGEGGKWRRRCQICGYLTTFHGSFISPWTIGNIIANFEGPPCPGGSGLTLPPLVRELEAV